MNSSQLLNKKSFGLVNGTEQILIKFIETQKNGLRGNFKIFVGSAVDNECRSITNHKPSVYMFPIIQAKVQNQHKLTSKLRSLLLR